MSPCCDKPSPQSASGPAFSALAWFERMIPNCLEYARREHAAGRPIVGIMCEFTPREIIMAGGGVPVCLCGGSAETVGVAEQELPANLCPLIKSTYGYDLALSNPFIEMADLIVAETTCDGKKKMFELMGERRPMHVLELPQKSADADALAHWRGELVKLIDTLSRRWSVAIDDEKLLGAIATMNRERRLRRSLAELMISEKPPLTGRQLLLLKSSISGIEADFEQYESALAELTARATADSPRRPRVLLTGVPIPHGAERVVDIIERAGGLIVAAENCTGLKPIVDDVDEALAERDPIGALAEKYFHLPCSVMTPNDARIELIGRLAKRFRADCVIDLAWQACLTYDVESSRARRYVEDELGLPYLHLETDYSPADSARLSVRIEALLEMI